MTYSYLIEPNKPTADGHYFIGGALCSEAILACALAVAESQEDDTIGVKSNEAKVLLHSAIELDLKRTADSVGMMDASNFLGNDPRLARELRWYGPTTEVYGVS